MNEPGTHIISDHDLRQVFTSLVSAVVVEDFLKEQEQDPGHLRTGIRTVCDTCGRAHP